MIPIHLTVVPLLFYSMVICSDWCYLFLLIHSIIYWPLHSLLFYHLIPVFPLRYIPNLLIYIRWATMLEACCVILRRWYSCLTFLLLMTFDVILYYDYCWCCYSWYIRPYFIHIWYLSVLIYSFDIRKLRTLSSSFILFLYIRYSHSILEHSVVLPFVVPRWYTHLPHLRYHTFRSYILRLPGGWPLFYIDDDTFHILRWWYITLHSIWCSLHSFVCCWPVFVPFVCSYRLIRWWSTTIHSHSIHSIHSIHSFGIPTFVCNFTTILHSTNSDTFVTTISFVVHCSIPSIVHCSFILFTYSCSTDWFWCLIPFDLIRWYLLPYSVTTFPVLHSSPVLIPPFLTVVDCSVVHSDTFGILIWCRLMNFDTFIHSFVVAVYTTITFVVVIYCFVSTTFGGTDFTTVRLPGSCLFYIRFLILRCIPHYLPFYNLNRILPLPFYMGIYLIPCCYLMILIHSTIRCYSIRYSTVIPFLWPYHSWCIWYLFVLFVHLLFITIRYSIRYIDILLFVTMIRLFLMIQCSVFDLISFTLLFDTVLLFYVSLFWWRYLRCWYTWHLSFGIPLIVPIRYSITIRPTWWFLHSTILVFCWPLLI